jgi:hypothetical protein
VACEQMRVCRTDQDVLVANVRCEVGGFITTRVLLQHSMVQAEPAS